MVHTGYRAPAFSLQSSTLQATPADHSSVSSLYALASCSSFQHVLSLRTHSQTGPTQICISAQSLLSGDTNFPSACGNHSSVPKGCTTPQGNLLIILWYSCLLMLHWQQSHCYLQQVADCIIIAYQKGTPSLTCRILSTWGKLWSRGFYGKTEKYRTRLFSGWYDDSYFLCTFLHSPALWQGMKGPSYGGRLPRAEYHSAQQLWSAGLGTLSL